MEPFRIQGTRDEAVVLIHGFTGHPGHWIPMAERMGVEGYTVLAPRLAGHGDTIEALGSSVWQEWVESAARATGTMSDHRRVHLVGLSLGGLIGILVARRVAATSLATINAPLVLRQKTAYLAPLARHLVPFLPAPADEVPDPDLAHLWVAQERRSTAAVDQLLRVIWRAWREAARLRRPALVIQSERDEAVHPVSGFLLARRLHGRLLRVDTRHNALLDPGRAVVEEAVVGHLARASGVDPACRRH